MHNISWLEIDSVAQELRLPASKLDRVRAELRSWGTRRSGTKRQLLSLVRRLQHCCQAITLGRPFIRRLIDRAYSVEELHKFVHLTVWEKEDLEWWHSLIANWNGRSLFLLPKWEQAPDTTVTSDASGSVGFGAVSSHEFFACKWPKNLDSLNIAIKEMIPIVIAAKIWGHSWERKRIVFRSDNMAVVFCLRNSSCRDRHLCFLLRELSMLAVTQNFLFTAIHLPGCENKAADALSRFNFQTFHKNTVMENMQRQNVSQDLLAYLLSPPWIKTGSIS